MEKGGQRGGDKYRESSNNKTEEGTPQACSVMTTVGRKKRQEKGGGGGEEMEKEVRETEAEKGKEEGTMGVDWGEKGRRGRRAEQAKAHIARTTRRGIFQVKRGSGKGRGKGFSQ